MSPVCQNCLRELPKPDDKNVWFVHHCVCGKVHWLRRGEMSMEILLAPPEGAREHQEKCQVLKETMCNGVVTDVPLWYPGSPDPSSHQVIQVSLVHVRAADDIRILFDMARNGWVVQQPVWGRDRAEEEEKCTYIDSWKEVGFFEAWAFEPKEEEEPEVQQPKVIAREVEGGKETEILYDDALELLRDYASRTTNSIEAGEDTFEGLRQRLSQGRVVRTETQTLVFPGIVAAPPEVVFGVVGIQTKEDLEAVVKAVLDTMKLAQKGAVPVLKMSQYDFAGLSTMRLNFVDPATAVAGYADDNVEELKVVTCMHEVFHPAHSEEYPMSHLIVVGDNFPTNEQLQQPHVLEQLGEVFDVTRIITPEKPVGVVHMDWEDVFQAVEDTKLSDVEKLEVYDPEGSDG